MIRPDCPMARDESKPRRGRQSLSPEFCQAPACQKRAVKYRKLCHGCLNKKNNATILRRCSVEGCVNKSTSNRAIFCAKHSTRLRRTGKLSIDNEPTDRCKHCWVKIPIGRSSYCSTRCQSRHKRRVDESPWICPVCQRQAIGKRLDAKYCSTKCTSRANKLISKYGITPEIYNAMRRASGGKCDICRKEQCLVVDHSHAEGKARGLICRACNLLLGTAFDNIQLLLNAASYLENSSRRYEDFLAMARPLYTDKDDTADTCHVAVTTQQRREARVG